MNTIAEYLKQNPNTMGKAIIYTEAYVQMRYTLMKQIANIENSIDGTLLSSDAEIKQKLLPSLKRTLNGLDRRFLRADPILCASQIVKFEREQTKDPLRHCLYYDGKESESDGTDKGGVLYGYEQKWVRFILNNCDESTYFVHMIAEYMHYGLLRFPEHGNTPISLMALLFNRYCHWDRVDIDGFKEWYLKDYKRG